MLMICSSTITDIKMLETAGGVRKEVVSEENRETKSEIWFSHKEDVYNAELKGTQKVFYWTDHSQMWDWDNCTVSWLPRDGNSSRTIIRIVIRSLNTVFSEYQKKDVKIPAKEMRSRKDSMGRQA
jgi:NDP-sugar pyrophosphorylase family protein